MANENNNKNENKGGPLTQVIRGGAKTGIIEKVNEKNRDLTKEAKVTVKTEPASTSMDSILLEMLQSKSKEARLEAIKIAGEKGDAGIAGKIVLAAAFSEREYRDAEYKGSRDVFFAAVDALANLLKRTGADALHYLLIEGLNNMEPLKDQNGNNWSIDYNREKRDQLELVARAVSSSGLVEGIGVLEQIAASRLSYVVRQSLRKYIHSFGNGASQTDIEDCVKRAYNCVSDDKDMNLAVLSAIAKYRLYGCVGLIEKTALHFERNTAGVGCAATDIIRLIEAIGEEKPNDAVILLQRIRKAYAGIDGYNEKIDVAAMKAIGSMM